MLLAGMPIRNTAAAQDCDASGTLSSCVLHGVPQYYGSCSGLTSFLAALCDDDEIIESFGEDLIDTGRELGRKITYVNRKNMIDFTYFVDSFRVTYHLWLRPKDNGEGELAVNYYLGKKWHSSTDPWIYPRFPGRALAEYDSISDFRFHVWIVAQLMRADLFIPVKLSERLAFNFKNASNLDDCLTMMSAMGLIVLTNERTRTIVVSNGQRSFCLLSNGAPDKFFSISPGWQ